MDEMMKFPKTAEEFMEQYKVVDTENVYSNGAEFVPIFRMKQWFEHIAEKTGKWIEQDDEWSGVYYECSVCKEAFTFIDGTPTDNLYNYCPNCGALMVSENDDIR